MGQHLKRLLASWHNIEQFAVSAAMHERFSVETPAFWRDLGILCCLIFPMHFCLSYFSGILTKSKTLVTSRESSLAFLESVDVAINAFFRTGSYGVVSRWAGARICSESNRLSAIGSLRFRR